jgi:abortive infection bacteriophage resistance protein
MAKPSDVTTQATHYLSGIRLHRFAQRAAKSNTSMLDLYFLNLSVSEQLFGLISLVEIVLRNQIHHRLAPKNYLDDTSGVLSKNDYKRINKVKKDILKSGAAPKNIESRLLSNLTMGFWCGLFDDDKLWASDLSMLFEKSTRQKYRITAGKIRDNLKKLRRVRNKIAHHERIVFRRDLNLDDHIDAVANILSWLIHQGDADFAQYIAQKIEEKRKGIKNTIGGA